MIICLLILAINPMRVFKVWKLKFGKTLSPKNCYKDKNSSIPEFIKLIIFMKIQLIITKIFILFKLNLKGFLIWSTAKSPKIRLSPMKPNLIELLSGTIKKDHFQIGDFIYCFKICLYSNLLGNFTFFYWLKQLILF